MTYVRKLGSFHKLVLVFVLAIGPIGLALDPEARSSVFKNRIAGTDGNGNLAYATYRWPKHTGYGDYFNIRVCITDDSKVQQKIDRDRLIGRNPGMQEVLKHITNALHSGWELYTRVRWSDFRFCAALSAAERKHAIGLWIHEDAPNRAETGTTGRGITTTDTDADGDKDAAVNVKPWGKGGDSDACARYDTSTAHVEFEYDCVEQYARHEFGHSLGFLHEWYHPDTPEPCASYNPDTDTDNPNTPEVEATHRKSLAVKAPATWGATYDTNAQGVPLKDYTIPNGDYDRTSIMTYNGDGEEKGCVDPQGEEVHFGGENLSDHDRAGAAAVYGYLDTPNRGGEHDVGVFSDGRCGSPETISRPVTDWAEWATIRLDTEDEANEDETAGWTGMSGLSDGSSVRLEFCRVDGDLLKTHADRYGVLKLGQSCPSGSGEVTRYFDLEDEHNASWTAGNVRPNQVNDNATLAFCIFPASGASAGMQDFPDLGFPYGVLGHSMGISTGWIYTDDDDEGNENDLIDPGGLSYSGDKPLIEAGNNTRLYVAKVCCRELPTIAAHHFGTAGLDDWYVGDVTVSFDVTGAATTSGCDTVVITEDTPSRTITCSATNADGTTTEDVTIKRDTVSPEAPDITSGPTGPISDTTPVFEFTTTHPQTTFQCRLDLNGRTPCTSPHQAGPLGDGEHTFRVRGVDQAGNIGPDSSPRVVFVDDDAPDTAFAATPPDLGNSATVVHAFDSGEAATFECRLGTGDWRPCTSPHTTPDLADGTYAFAVRAVDLAGNVDQTPAVDDFRVDTAPPETSLESGPPVFTNSATPTFTYTSDDGVRFECRLGGGDWVACSTPHTVAALADGEHTFQVRAGDAAGNVDPTPATSTFTVDTRPPQTTIVDGPHEFTNDPTPRFEIASDEVTGTTFICKIDDQDYAACASPLTLATLTDGSHTLLVRATDRAGNMDQSPAQSTFTVDTIAPETTISDGPPAHTNDTTPTLTFAAGEPATFTCGLGSSDHQGCTSPHTTGALADGDYTFDVIATDRAGNVDPTAARRTFTVDTVAPRTTITAGPDGPTLDSTPQFAFEADEAVQSFACSIDDGPAAECSSPTTTPVLADGDQGTHRFYVRATDLAGNVEATAVRRDFLVTAPSRLKASPATVSLDGLKLRLQAAATLTHARTGQAIAGREITFTTNGRLICKTSTNAAGVARCSALLGLLQVVIGLGYDAAFVGDGGRFAPASAHGSVVSLG